MNSKKLLYLFVFLSGFIFSNIPFEDNDLLNVDEAFIFNVEVKKNKIIASWEIKPGYYLYKKSISIQKSLYSLVAQPSSFFRPVKTTAE